MSDYLSEVKNGLALYKYVAQHTSIQVASLLAYTGNKHLHCTA